MQVSCPRCNRILEYSGERPLFCAFCAQPLDPSDPRLLATAVYNPIINSPGVARISSGDEHETTFAETHRSHAFDELDPERVAGYKILKRLGRGGMGSVYEAEDVELGRLVALKLIATDHISSREAVERFRQEGRLASTLTHPRCVFVLAADEFEGRPYIVMELMPGETLQTLVESRGPLPVGEAVAKILDVIEGLREAHTQGVIHRDVKPSNCFLEANGRVKVGDFGLSKSLDNDSSLTITGSFIGTPLYASPEQIKRDIVDERTDVYSVAATLYYLLAGRPPFQADDAAATLAKIVSEPPTPLRQLKADVPAALEAAILRGLERDRNRRYQSLSKFRSALLPFVSSQLTLSDLGLRFSAYLADNALIWIVYTLIVFSLVNSPSEEPRRALSAVIQYLFSHIVMRRILFLTYFSISEGVWGASLGKRLTRLRVSRVENGGPPGLFAAIVRVFVLFIFTGLMADIATILLFNFLPTKSAVFYEPLVFLVAGLGYIAVGSTMRAENRYRGLHEWASGTQVDRVPRSERLQAPRVRRLPSGPDRAREMVTRQAGVMQVVGPFKVRGAVRWEGDHRVLLGEDSTLERPVWIVLRPKGSPAPVQARRDLGRPSRPRWLIGGEQAEGRWDAFAAPVGCPLVDLAGKDGLPWADTRPILLELADELAKSCKDETLPEVLSVDQVWIQPDGTVQFVDPLIPRNTAQPVVGKAEERSLELLRRTAAQALEGGRRRPGTSPNAILAPVPEHAARMLDRLIKRPRKGDSAYTHISDLIADLEADRDKPTEVNTIHRALQVGPGALILAIPLTFMFFILARPNGQLLANATWLVAMIPSLWVLWAAMIRGGILYELAGLSLVRSDSRPAERWRCAWRCFVTWLPITGLLAISCWARAHQPPYSIQAWTSWGLALATVVSYPILALALPTRAPNDVIAGTYVVPK